MVIDWVAHARRTIESLGAQWSVSPGSGSITGILAAPYGEVGEGATPGVASSQPEFTTMFADLAAQGAEVGATLTRGALSYKIAFVPDAPEQPSGRAVLKLEKA